MEGYRSSLEEEYQNSLEEERQNSSVEERQNSLEEELQCYSYGTSGWPEVFCAAGVAAGVVGAVETAFAVALDEVAVASAVVVVDGIAVSEALVAVTAEV